MTKQQIDELEKIFRKHKRKFDKDTDFVVELLDFIENVDTEAYLDGLSNGENSLPF